MLTTAPLVVAAARNGGHVRFAIEPEEDGDDERREGDPGDAAEGGGVAGCFFDPTGAERVGRVLRIAQRADGPVIECLRVAFEDVFGYFDEAPERSGSDGEHDEHDWLDVGEPGAEFFEHD